MLRITVDKWQGGYWRWDMEGRLVGRCASANTEGEGDKCLYGMSVKYR